MRKMTVWPSCWKWRSLRMRTVWPRWRSGAVGSKPALMRSGRPVARECSRRAREGVFGVGGGGGDEFGDALGDEVELRGDFGECGGVGAGHDGISSIEEQR